MRRLFQVGLVFFVSVLIGKPHSFGQMTASMIHPEQLYNDGIRAFESSDFNDAALLLEDYSLQRDEGLVNETLLEVQAEVYRIRMAYDSDRQDADEWLDRMERRVPGHFLLAEAYLARGNYYFRQKNYTEAINTFRGVNLDFLNRQAGQMLKFKLAYSLFVKKRFNEAAALFEELSYVKNDYFYPANYYLGICQFLRSDFSDAINSFKVVEQTTEYRPHIPYYLVQLYFTQGDYDTTVDYGEAQLQQKDLKNRYKIHHIIGATYFIKENYKAALPHFKKYEENTAKLSKDDFYQLGFINYQLGFYAEAIPNFLELSDVEGALGQNANYYLADCYLKQGKKLSARTAMKKVTEYGIANNMQEECFLNFGKLSAEMGYDREAIDALFEIPSNSLYYNEAQEILSELFVQTRDYAKAQSILEAKDEVSHQLFEAYQKVCYYKALQALRNDDEETAVIDLKKAIKTDRDLSITAKSYYWLAEIAQRQGEYQESSHRMIKYFLLIKGVEKIAGEAAPAFAHYVQGYNYIKLEQYQAALDEFQASLAALPEEQSVDQEQKNRIFINAKLRAGDCAFKVKQFDTALGYYDYIISSGSTFTPYALYQKAIIQHLTRNIYGAISILQSLVQNYPGSDMVGLSLMHLGDMYIELNEPSRAYDAFLGLVNSELNGNEVRNKALLKLGLLSYNMGDIRKSRDYYQQVLENNPSGNERKEALDALEEIYINDLNQAAAFLTLAREKGGVRLENQYQDSITYTVAKILYDKDSLALAEAAFREYIDQFPLGYYAVEAHFFRGKSQIFMRNYQEAYADFNFVVELGPGTYYHEACLNAALISFNYLRDFGRAYNHYKQLEESLTNETKKYEAQLGALRSAFRMGNFQGVNRFADKVVKNPLATTKEIASAYYYIGKVAYEQKKYDEAIQAFNQVINRFKSSTLAAESRYHIALIYYDRGEYNLAEELCKNANMVNSAYPYWIAKSLILLSDILVKKGDLFNARAALEATIENYREDKELLNEAERKKEIIISLQNDRSRLEKEAKDGTIKMDSPDDK